MGTPRLFGVVMSNLNKCLRLALVKVKWNESETNKGSRELLGEFCLTRVYQVECKTLTMWRLPTKIFFRESGLLTLPEIIQNNILSKVSSLLIVTDRGLNSSTSWIDQLSYSLQSDWECDIKIYDSTPVNPRIETVEEITNMSLENKCDLIIGIGGGSSIDAAKAAAMYSSPINNIESLSTFIGKPNSFSNVVILPFIAIPSTCVTGS